jgi:hypothetical protein
MIHGFQPLQLGSLLIIEWKNGPFSDMWHSPQAYFLDPPTADRRRKSLTTAANSRIHHGLRSGNAGGGACAALPIEKISHLRDAGFPWET